MMSQQTRPTPLRISLTSGSRISTFVARAFVTGLLLFVVGATVFTTRSNATRERTALRARTDAVVVSIEDRLSSYDEMLFGVRGAFDVADPLSRDAYHEMIDRLAVETRQPGVQVIGAAHLQKVSDIADWEREINQQTSSSALPYPTFSVYPDSSLEQVLAIDYLEPQIGNERAFGLDFFSEPKRRAAALRARDTGLPASTAPVTLVQETGSQQAFLVMVPLYRPHAPISTLEQRRAAFDGVVYAAFRMGDLMAGILGEDDHSDIAVVDVGAGELLHGEGLGTITALSSDDDRLGSVAASGRTWRVSVDSEDPVLSRIERVVPVATMLVGLFIIALFTALLRQMRSTNSQAVALAAEMTDELEALTESTTEAIVSVDESGAIVAWNSGATQIFRTTADEMLGEPVNRLVPARDRTVFDTAFASAMSGMDPTLVQQSIRVVGRRATGEEFPAEMSISTWSARDRRFLTGFVRDVTDRVEAEKQLRETTDTLLGVLGAATEMSIIGTDPDGMITVFNVGAERMLGYRASELIGTATAAQFHDADEVFERAGELGIEPGFEVFVAVARTGQAETRRWTYIRHDGTRLPVELTVTPRYDSDGRLCGFIGVALDITDRIAATARQQQLLSAEREMVAKLTQLDRVKNDFVSTTSHELRTPLTSIIGYSEILSDLLAGAGTHQSVEMVGIIEKNAQRLLLLVEDLLLLSRIESGALHLTREPCDSARILESVRDAVAPQASGRGISVVMHHNELPSIEGDSPQLERVFLNLLTNAVKFSHDGGTIEVVAEATDVLTVKITDHGIGIPADEQGDVFTRFFRSRNAEENAIQGTGLGLTIVANIVERHGGRIDLASQVGVGTTVTVILPITAVPATPQEQELFA